MPTLSELQEALVAADAAAEAGGVDSDDAANDARQLAKMIRRAEGNPTNMIPDMPIDFLEPEEETAEGPSMGEHIVGAGETALSMATGATGGMAGMVGGFMSQLAKEVRSGEFGTADAADRIEQAAMELSGEFTYAPRTEAGQSQSESLGELGQQLAPIAPMAAEISAITHAAKFTKPYLTSRGKAFSMAPETTPGDKLSVGAGKVPQPQLRQASAGELPVPMRLSKGQASRKFEDVRFERETAKDPELGGPLRERFTEQNLQLQQNLDEFIDAGGGIAPDHRTLGMQVDKALRDELSRTKTKVRSLYNAATKKGEMAEKVDVTPITKYLDDNASAESTAPVLKGVRAELGRLQKADGYALSINNAEQLRKFINKTAGDDRTNVHFAKELKEVIDATTEGKGGPLYKKARAARYQQAKDFERRKLVFDLLGTKRGTDDRRIAYEGVLRKSIVDASATLDDIKHLKKLLDRSDDGKQAWNELKSGAVQWIRDEAVKNVARDEAGNPIVSAAKLDKSIQQLDNSGKLDFVFGKKGAEQLRTLNDVAKDVLTVPPGSVNTSNTASVVLAAMDMAVSGSVGVPAPILSGAKMLIGKVKNKRTTQQVKKHLRGTE